MDIDIVFLWCDGDDPQIREKREFYLNNSQKEISLEAKAKGRFKNNDELKYALRSVEKFAPFFRKIFIVTDNQVPSWLNTNHPKITIVDHKDIIPQEYLPTFNAYVIESFIHKIPDLSEHFVFANDDMFFTAPCNESFFFDKQGNTIVYGKKTPDLETIGKDKFLNKVKHLNYIYNCYSTLLLVNKKLSNCKPFLPHHNIDAYNKNAFIEVSNLLKEEYQTTYSHKFRELYDVSRLAAHEYEIIKGYATLRYVDRLSKKRLLLTPMFLLKYSKHYISIDMSLVSLYEKGPSFRKKLLKKFSLGQIKLACFNDTQDVTDTHRACFQEFAKELFPEKSPFEL